MLRYLKPRKDGQFPLYQQLLPERGNTVFNQTLSPLRYY